MVTKEDVKKSADISRIAINELELEKYVDDLNDMMRFINMVDNKDFNSEKSFDCFNVDKLELRRDKICPSLDYEHVFNNTSLRTENFFVLKEENKII